MDFLKVFGMLGQLIKIMALFANLKGVRALDPATTAESYAPAAVVALEDPATQQFVAKLPAEQQTQFAAMLPAFLWYVDTKSERF